MGLVGPLLQDLRFGLRLLVKHPGFAAPAVLTLALGIGATTAIFSVVNTVLLRPLPYHEPDRLVWIWASSPTRGIPFHFFQYPDFVDWRAQARSFESMAAYSPSAAALTGGAESADPEYVPRLRVNAAFFHVLGIRPALGRDFVEADDRPGAARVVVVSHELFERRFGGDPNLIGRAITLDGEDHTVIGVLPAGFRTMHMQVQAYTPIALGGSRSGPERNFSLAAFARLKPGVRRKQAQAETDAIVGRLDAEYFRKAQRGIRLWGAREFLVRDVRSSLLVLLAAVALVLLVACANVANLLLARASAREKELAARIALGAGRGRIVRQLLTESSLLGLLGGGLGLALAWWGVRLLVLVTPPNYPLVAGTRVDLRVLGSALLASLLTGLVFGLAPALAVSRGDACAALKEGGRSTAAGARHGRLRGLLVVFEVALALALTVGAGLLLKGFLRLQQVNPGFNARGVLIAGLNLSSARHSTPQKRLEFHREFLNRLEATPGVKAAGIVTALPLSGINMGAAIHIEGRAEPRPDEAPTVWWRSATAGYFRALEIPLRRGRLFTEHDNENSERVALVNEAMARRFWPGEDPLGKRFGLGLTHRPVPNQPVPAWITVVGVLGDVRHTALAQAAEPEFFMPYMQRSYPAVAVAVRTAAEPARLASALRAAAAAVDRQQPVSQVASLEERLVNSIAPQRLAVWLLGIFAALATALAALGVYGVMSFSTQQRTQEIGVRLALGAQPADILRLILRQGMTLAGTGLTAGLGGAYCLARFMHSLLYEVSPGDPLIYGGGALTLAAVALVAVWIPARRATRVAPAGALRHA